MNGLDLNNILKMPIGLYDSKAHNGVVATALFVFFKKKQWILVGELPVVKYERKDKKPMQH